MLRSVVTLLLGSVLVGACHFPFSNVERDCALVGFPAVEVRVRDQWGRAAAWGTKLVVRDGDYADSAIGEYGYQVSNVGAAYNRAGDYVLHLSRPGYFDAEIPNVHVPGNECGAISTVMVNGFIGKDPAAPLPHQLAVDPESAELGIAGYALQYRVRIETDPGADSTVTWSIDDTTVATITTAGGLISKCRTQDGNAVITATSVANPQKRAMGHLTVHANAKAC